MLNASHCCPPFRVQKKGEERAGKERNGTETLKDDESGRKQKPDGFLSWLSSRCRLQQTPASMQPGEETWRQLCGNADPDCSYQLWSSQNRSTIHKENAAWIISNHYIHTHTHTHAMWPLSYGGCWSRFCILKLISKLKKQVFVAHLWTFDIWSYCRHSLFFLTQQPGCREASPRCDFISTTAAKERDVLHVARVVFCKQWHKH